MCDKMSYLVTEIFFLNEYYKVKNFLDLFFMLLMLAYHVGLGKISLLHETIHLNV